MSSTSRIYECPVLTSAELEKIDELRGLYRRLKLRLVEPSRWLGALARSQLARSIQGSNSIEGYNTSITNVLAAIDFNEQVDDSSETVEATQGYRDAMTYVLQLSGDADATFDVQLIKSLHFMLLRHDLDSRPGLFRRGGIRVVNESTGQLVYSAPDVVDVSALMGLFAWSLQEPSESINPLVGSALAHLNLTMIHPFADGNGRMARCLQTLMLTRAGVLKPMFSSIEEEIGNRHRDYYQVLAEVGQGSWNPQKNALPFVSFCLDAHLCQAATLEARIRFTEDAWAVIDNIVIVNSLPERVVGPLHDAYFGRSLRRPDYISIVEGTEVEPISQLTASRDLRALTEHELLAARGATSGRRYEMSKKCRELIHRELNPDVQASIRQTTHSELFFD